MAELNKPTDLFYENLGGVDEKGSMYVTDRTQCLNLRNIDFFSPNAWQKRPGSTFAVAASTSGPITSLFEYEKLTGESFVIAGSDTAMFYLASANYTLLSTGFNNGQPADMLTFVNKLWIANGGKFVSWDGVNAVVKMGPPCPEKLNPWGGASTTLQAGASFNSFWGITMPSNVASFLQLWIAYAYVRSDGFLGPTNLFDSQPQFYYTTLGGISQVPAVRMPLGVTLSSFTTPSEYGITGIAIYGALFNQASYPASASGFPGIGFSQTISNAGAGSPYASNLFQYITTIPAGSTVAFFSASMIGSWSLGTVGGLVTGQTAAFGFSGGNLCFANTFTPKYIDVNQNIMFMSGFSSAPSQVYHSDIGAPDVIQPDNTFEVRTNDGDRIYAQKAYKNQLIIMKQKSFHKVIGDNPDNYELVELSLEYGCLSNKTVIEFREKLAWLDRQGVLEYNGVDWAIISTPIEDTFRRMNLTIAQEKACAVHYSFRNQLWFGIPVDETTKNNLTVVYDYLVGAWTFFDGFNPASFQQIKSGLNVPTAWRGDYSGLIHYHSASFYQDSAGAFTCLAFSRFDAPDGQNVTDIFRRLFLDVIPVTGTTGAINCQVFTDYNMTNVQATFTIYQSQFQTRKDFGVVGKAVAFQFSHFNASLPLDINGYAWTRRYLRNV